MSRLGKLISGLGLIGIALLLYAHWFMDHYSVVSGPASEGAPRRLEFKP
jgi:hypothetical protein